METSLWSRLPVTRIDSGMINREIDSIDKSNKLPIFSSVEITKIRRSTLNQRT